MTSFLDWEGIDPASAARKAGTAMARARHEIEKSGIKSFLFHADSPEEFDQRLEMRGVADAFESASSKYLNEVSDGRAKLARYIKREFEANTKKKAPEIMISKTNDEHNFTSTEQVERHVKGEHGVTDEEISNNDGDLSHIHQLKHDEEINLNDKE